MDASRLLRRYEEDRFVRPGLAPSLRLREVEDAYLRAVPEGSEWLTPSPLVPLGTHAALGGVSQDRLVTTVRMTEVAADPTAALALEAAARRRRTSRRRTDPPLRLASFQRVTRAQRFVEEAAFAHFELFALVTAGRSQPRGGFDAPALLEHLRVHVSALAGAVVDGVRIVLSVPDDGPGATLLDATSSAFSGAQAVTVVHDPERLPSQRYYQRACFKVHATFGASTFEVADGGFTDWTERLLADRHERLLTSAAGLDRVALALDGG
jgi:hypothetical protein